MSRNIALPLVLLVMIAGCGGNTTGNSAISGTTAVVEDSTSAVNPTAMSAGASAAGIPPKPDAATQAAYIAALEEIDPNIVDGKPDRAVSRGRDQCSSVGQMPTAHAELADLVGKRLTSAEHPEGFGSEKSTAILAAVRKHLCPTY